MPLHDGRISWATALRWSNQNGPASVARPARTINPGNRCAGVQSSRGQAGWGRCQKGKSYTGSMPHSGKCHPHLLGVNLVSGIRWSTEARETLPVRTHSPARISLIPRYIVFRSRCGQRFQAFSEAEQSIGCHTMTKVLALVPDGRQDRGNGGQCPCHNPWCKNRALDTKLPDLQLHADGGGEKAACSN